MKDGNRILIHNKEYECFGEPLKSYRGFTINKPGAGVTAVSPLSEGYYADWILKDDALYLCDFTGLDFNQENNYNFERFFGAKNIPFFAHWFCGEIRVWEGEIIYTTVQKRDIKKYVFIMTFEKGKLINTEMQDATLPSVWFEALSRMTLYSF